MNEMNTYSILYLKCNRRFKYLYLKKSNRKHVSIIQRSKIGHAYETHKYRLRSEPTP